MDENKSYWWAPAGGNDPFPWCVGTGDKIIAWVKSADHARIFYEVLSEQNDG